MAWNKNTSFTRSVTVGNYGTINLVFDQGQVKIFRGSESFSLALSELPTLISALTDLINEPDVNTILDETLIPLVQG